MRNIKLFWAMILVLVLVATIIGCKAEIGEITETEEPEGIADHAAAVVSLHKLATEAGIEILAAGGTAADAAITVAAVLTVVEPYFSSVLGGGTWALYYSSETGEVTSLDGVGPVGSKATVQDYAERAGQHGMHQSVVPGAWDGWMLWFKEYGILDLDEVLAPAIRIAKEGYPVSSSMATWLNRHSQLIANRPDTAKIYMPQGKLLQEGDIAYQHDLAHTFATLSNVYIGLIDKGRGQAIEAVRDFYYRGPLAEEIVDFSDKNNGYLTLDDFRNFKAEIVEPISIQYNSEIEVYENPPNSQGITMLIALNILKGYDFSRLDPDDPDFLHLQVEALKLAFADRYYHIGDPDRVEISIKELLSDRYASKQRERIGMATAMRWPIADGLADEPEVNNTTTFHVVDKNGNAAAVTTSLGAQFMVAGNTGIHMNNRMRMISLEDSNPNQLTPGYKVRHTSNPYMALKNGKPYILGGNTGVDNQPQVQLQQFMHIVESGLSAQEAVERPRFASTAFPAGTYPYEVDNTLRMEEGFPAGLLHELRSKGHNVVSSDSFGSASIIVILGDGSDAQIGAESRVATSYGIVTRAQEK